MSLWFDFITGQYPQVEYYEDLPTVVNIDEIYIVQKETTETSWLFFTKVLYFSGLYKYNGITWIYLGNTYDTLIELDDVGISSPAVKDILTYEELTGRWKNQSITTVMPNRPEIFYGTGTYPDPTDLEDGTLYFKYT